MDALAANGLRPEDIDYVMCTHMHVDHVGWNTQLVDGRWVPTFPNAKYLFSKKEFDYWNAENDQEPMHHFEDSVLPIVRENRAQMITSDYALDDEIRLEPTPGHTPDHYAVQLHSGGRQAVFSGDLMHSPIQCRHPEWRARPDYDAQQARETRKAFMEKYCETDVLVVTAHFPLPSAGRFVRHGDAFMFEYDNEDW
jgi:glyoxylase-like metal-dependent hydrolase (beta-lactamase superfamily II)